MVPYDTYRIYQIERAKSLAEVRRADEQAARFAAAVSSLFGGIMRPVRAVRALHPAGSCDLPRPAQLAGPAGSKANPPSATLLLA